MFLFKQKTAYEMRISDWSSDVCSSDLLADDVQCRSAMTGPSQIFIGNHGAERANGVVDDRFPFQDGAWSCGDAALTQQWNDHGRSGDHQNAREQDRHRPDKPRTIKAGQPTTAPGPARNSVG